MQPAKPKYYKWAFFEQSLRMKEGSKEEDLEPVDPEHGLPQVSCSRAARPVKGLSFTYPPLDSLSLTQIFDVMGALERVESKLLFSHRNTQYGLKKRTYQDPPYINRLNAKRQETTTTASSPVTAAVSLNNLIVSNAVLPIKKLAEQQQVPATSSLKTATQKLAGKSPQLGYIHPERTKLFTHQ
ncbi:hypothetical protein BX070DRAFT_236709 [Coemansia spiralis]|nr:hypothetical protein BX070DRAFT_236709 [Coemansia spiralis]